MPSMENKNEKNETKNLFYYSESVPPLPFFPSPTNIDTIHQHYHQYTFFIFFLI